MRTEQFYVSMLNKSHKILWFFNWILESTTLELALLENNKVWRMQFLCGKDNTCGDGDQIFLRP